MNILLLGASGFLGVHLLQNLLLNGYNVYALVRSIDTFYENLSYFNISLINTEGSLKVIESKNFLNIDLESINDVDLVINCAGKVSNSGNYSDFYNSNVLVTKKFAEFYKEKFVHISTLSVFVASKTNYGIHDETSNISKDLIGNYALSKAESEKYVLDNNGFIIRPGLLTPSTYNNIHFKNSFLETFLKSLKTLEFIPYNFTEAFVDITPVDICSDIITMYITDILYHKNKINCLHIANKYSMSLSSILSLFDIKLKCNDNEWFEYINESNYTNLQKMLLKNAFFKGTLINNNDKLFNFDLFQSTGHYYGKNCFSIDNKAVVKKYITK